MFSKFGTLSDVDVVRGPQGVGFLLDGDGNYDMDGRDIVDVNNVQTGSIYVDDVYELTPVNKIGVNNTVNLKSNAMHNVNNLYMGVDATQNRIVMDNGANEMHVCASGGFDLVLRAEGTGEVYVEDALFDATTIKVDEIRERSVGESVKFANGLKTNIINERTGNSGVTIDGILLKDGTLSSTLGDVVMADDLDMDNRNILDPSIIKRGESLQIVMTSVPNGLLLRTDQNGISAQSRVAVKDATTDILNNLQVNTILNYTIADMLIENENEDIDVNVQTGKEIRINTNDIPRLTVTDSGVDIPVLSADTLLSNDLDTQISTTLLIGKSTATKVEIADTGVITEIQGPLHTDTIVGLTSDIIIFDSTIRQNGTGTTPPGCACIDQNLDGDDDTTLQLFSAGHNNIQLSFDNYYDGTGQKSSSATSNYRMFKGTNLEFQYASGYTKGDEILSFPIGFYMTTDGGVHFNQGIYLGNNTVLDAYNEDADTFAFSSTFFLTGQTADYKITRIGNMVTLWVDNVSATSSVTIGQTILSTAGVGSFYYPTSDVHQTITIQDNAGFLSTGVVRILGGDGRISFHVDGSLSTNWTALSTVGWREFSMSWVI